MPAAKTAKKKKKAPPPVIGKIIEQASAIHRKIQRKSKPQMKLPIRSLSNVRYRPKAGYFQLLGKNKIRTLTVSTVKTFAQTLKMLAMSKDLVETGRNSTKREAYYQAYNWGQAAFGEQTESDTVMDDVEAMLSVNREQLHFRADEHGGEIAGELIVVDRDRRTKKTIEIDCTAFGSGAYSIPTVVESLKFKTPAKFVLAVETKGMFERLVEEDFFDKYHCILVSMGGVPSRACRRFVRRLSDTHKLPVYVFTDGDPYGYFNIYRTLKVGSGNAAHLNEYFCVPARAVPGRHARRHRGIRPADPPAEGSGHQTGQRRDQKRSVHRALQGLAEDRRKDAPHGRPRRATGPGQTRPGLRRQNLSAQKTQKNPIVPALKNLPQRSRS